MSRIINLHDISIDLKDLICISISHRFEAHKIIFKYKLSYEYIFNPNRDTWTREVEITMISKIFTSFDEAREAYEAFILEWTRYKENKPRYYPLFDCIEPPE